MAHDLIHMAFFFTHILLCRVEARPFHPKHPSVFGAEPVFSIRAEGRCLNVLFLVSQCASDGQSGEWPGGVGQCSV